MLLKNNSGYVDAPTYRLLIALILSLLLHLALLTKLGPSSQNHSNSNLLQVRLVTPATPAQEIAEPVAAKSPAVEEPQQETLAPAKIAPLSASPSASATPPPQAAETPRKVNQKPEIPLPDKNSPASWAEIEFEIFSGEGRKLLGTGLQRYESDGLGQYQLSFKEKGEPEERAQNNSWQLQITGRIAQRGLMPFDFQRQGDLAEQLMALNEGSTASSIEIRNGRMPDGVLDRQSLLFQFMFSPPIDAGGQLMLTDGEKFGTYSYRIEGTEFVDVKAQGAVRTLRVVLSGSEYADIIELWLAPDFRYLPVKVRYTNSNGDVIEQLATTINFR